jgi:hypothetical protein
METYAVEWTEWAVHTLMFWETDDTRKGKIVRALHHFGTYALITLIVVSHTIYPAFWLQTLLYFFCVMVWMQHVLTNGCVISKVEQKLLGDKESFIDPYLELFHIEATDDSKSGLLTLGSTIAVLMMTLEWFSRVHHKILSQVPALVASSLQGIRLLPSSPSV